ncbi:MAG: peptide chain release factor N(5)-glutamine methyltransferase [Candidatus Ratteibacteria bacterium]|nr:peptide chain release factor N(5)-glutamine methyltransferase [Candidatus Ratteibacteria bacterium]
MLLEEVLSWGIQSIKSAGIEDAHIDVLAFLSDILTRDKSFIYSNLSMECSDFVLEKFFAMIKERSRHYPSAYIMGKKEFMSLNFMVNEKVLIPRPETEILVEEVLRFFPQADGNPRIALDIGTGCGNIALSLAEYNKNFRIYATDISSAAIELARKNAKLLNLEKSVSFINCDLWDCFKDKRWKGKIDILLSNPPYIGSEQLRDLAADLSFEPIDALDGGTDGLSFYGPLVDAGGFLLKKGGCLAMEIGQGQSEAVRNIIQNKKVFEDIIVKKDYSNIDRIIMARRK